MSEALSIQKIKNLQFGVVTLIMALFLLVNFTLLFGIAGQDWDRVILVYLVMTAYTFALPELKSRLFDLNFWINLPRFIISGIIGMLIIGAIGVVFVGNPLSTYLTSLTIGMILVQSFVVSVAEESIFREYLQNKIGIIPSNIIFSVFHLTAYKESIAKGMVAFIIGICLSYIKIWQDKQGNGKGLITILGLHAGANLIHV